MEVDNYPYYNDIEDEMKPIDESDLNGMSDIRDLNLEDTVVREANIWDVGIICVKEYNSETGTNLNLVKIEAAEQFYACGGYIYCLTLIAQNEKREQTRINKMAWQGAMLEVIQTKEKSISPEHKEKVHRAGGEPLGEAVAMFHTTNGGRSVHVDRVIDFQQIPNSQLPSGLINKGAAGYIDFSIYTVSVVATEWSKEPEFIIEGVVRRSTWVLPLNHRIANLFLSWRERVEKLPSHSTHSQIIYKSPEYMHELDLLSPQIVTQAWFALENYNLKKKTNLEFMSVNRAAKTIGTGICFCLTITVKDGPSLKTFTTESWEVRFLRYWISTSASLNPHQEAGSREQDDKIAVQGIASWPGTDVGMAF